MENSLEDRRGKNRTRRTETFTSLNTPKENLVTVVKEELGVREPAPTRNQNIPPRDKSKFCGFHQDFGNTTENYMQLKWAIERLIRESHLKEFVSERLPNERPERVIEVISLQFSSIKQIKRKIYNLSKPTLGSHFGAFPHEPIMFYDKDLELNEEARITPIVPEVGMTKQGINQCRVKRVLIDTGAPKNILYFKCFKEMGMNDSHLKLSNMVLEGFTSNKIDVKGTIKIKVTLGSNYCTREEEIKFYLVDIDSSYNAILGTPAHAAFELIISTSHQQVRFATRSGVGVVKSSPKSPLSHIMKSRKL